VALQEPGATTGGLLVSLRRIGASIVSIVHSHVELASLEIERERVRYTRLILLGIVGFFFLALAAITATVFVIVLFWDSQRLVVIGFLAVLYLGIGAAIAGFAQREAGRAKRPFSATVEQLRKDRDHFTRH